MRRMDAIADEFDHDCAAILEAWSKQAAGSSGTGASSAGVGFNLPGVLHNPAVRLRGGKNVIGRYARATPAPFGGDREWVQGTIDALESDLALWRSCRESALPAIASWFAASEKEKTALAASVKAADQFNRHRDDDEEGAALQEALDAAATIARGRTVAARVARARLQCLLDCLFLRSFEIYDTFPAPLVGRLEVDRVPFPEGLARWERAMRRIEEAELARAARAADANTSVEADAAEALAAVADDLERWRQDWQYALDLPASDLATIEKVVDEALGRFAALDEATGDVVKGAARRHQLTMQERAGQRKAAALTKEGDAAGYAGNQAGAQAFRAEAHEVWNQVNAEREEGSALERAAAPTLKAITALRDRHWLDHPNTPRITAVILSPSRELIGVLRPTDDQSYLETPYGTVYPSDDLTYGTLGYDNGPGNFNHLRHLQAVGPMPTRLALGVPFILMPIGAFPGNEPYRVPATAEAGDATRPVIVTDSRTGGSKGSWEQRTRDRLILVSAAAEKILSAPAPAAPPPAHGLEVRPRSRDPKTLESPIAGHWHVTYVDGALGWVRGEAEVSPDGTSAEFKFQYPGKEDVYPLVADDIRQEADGTYVMALRGQAPHLDARLGPPVKGGSGGSNDEWILTRPNGGPLQSTPPIPADLVRVPVAPGAVAVHVVFADQRTTFHFHPADPPPAAPITLRLRPIETKIHGWGYSEAFQIVKTGRGADESLQGLWEQPVDPATRQPTGQPSRYGLLERAPDNPNHARQIGVEIWWRGLAAKIQLLAQTVAGAIKVSRFFQGVPTVIEAVFDDPQVELTKEFTVTIDGSDLKVTAKRDPRDYRRFATDDLLVPATAGKSTSR